MASPRTLCSMRSSEAKKTNLPEFRPRTLLCCHDAGAANLLFSWAEASIIASESESSYFQVMAQGPAGELLRRYKPLNRQATNRGLEEALDGVDFLVAGSGWASDLELQAIRMAQNRGIYAVSVLDHWVNYADRFTRKGIKERPHELWVGDDIALRLAEDTFPELTVRMWRNAYLDKSVREVKFYEHQVLRESVNVVYLLEPIRARWGDSTEDGEFDALRFFFSNLTKLKLSSIDQIILKPHPSEARGKYSEIIFEYSGLGHRITIAEDCKLEELIASADVVIGCQTYAMVIALACGKRVVSSLPPWAPPCALPQVGIERLASLGDSCSVEN